MTKVMTNTATDPALLRTRLMAGHVAVADWTLAEDAYGAVPLVRLAAADRPEIHDFWRVQAVEGHGRAELNWYVVKPCDGRTYVVALLTVSSPVRLEFAVYFDVARHAPLLEMLLGSGRLGLTSYPLTGGEHAPPVTWLRFGTATLMAALSIARRSM